MKKTDIRVSDATDKGNYIANTKCATQKTQQFNAGVASVPVPSTCSASQYKVEDCNPCSTVQSCPSGWYQSSPCNASSNRICSPCTACTGGKIVDSECTKTSDR